MFIAATFTFVESLDLYKDIRAITWPTLTGTLYRTHSPNPVSHTDSYNSPIFEPLWTIRISFSYDVNGIKYNSNNKSFGFTFSENIELINSGDKDHPKVKVYFNPLDPNEAVLIPGPKAINIGLIALGAISLIWIKNRLNQVE